MQMLQAEIQGEAEKADITSEDDVMDLVNELRREQPMRVLIDTNIFESGLTHPKIMTASEFVNE